MERDLTDRLKGIQWHGEEIGRLQTTIEVLAGRLKESEALREAQATLIDAQEQQIRVIMAQLRGVQRALDIAQRTRAYRFLRRLGRWKFMEQLPVESPADPSPRHPLARAELGAPHGVKVDQLPPVTADCVELLPLRNAAEAPQQFMYDASYAKVRERKRQGGVAYASGSEDRIVQRLRLLGLEVSDYEIDVADYRRYFDAARYTADFPQYYSSNISEKSLEHYLAVKLLQLNERDVYIDIASEHSPAPEIYRRLFRARTYRQDLAYPSGLHGDMIGGDAARMPVPDGFATKMALHCSFEHFEGNSDTGFIREAARVLRPGGAVCIIPLYLFEEYAIQTDPVTALSTGVVFEDDAVVYCAKGWNNRYGRFYDPEHLVSRLCMSLSDLTVKIYRFLNVEQVDSSCYVRFAMLIGKSETC